MASSQNGYDDTEWMCVSKRKLKHAERVCREPTCELKAQFESEQKNVINTIKTLIQAKKSVPFELAVKVYGKYSKFEGISLTDTWKLTIYDFEQKNDVSGRLSTLRYNASKMLRDLSCGYSIRHKNWVFPEEVQQICTLEFGRPFENAYRNIQAKKRPSRAEIVKNLTESNLNLTAFKFLPLVILLVLI